MKSKNANALEYVVVSDRGGQRSYLGEDGWWEALKEAKRFSEEGAKIAVRKSGIATGYVPVDKAKPSRAARARR